MSQVLLIGLCAAASLILAALVCESCARLYRFRLAPVRLRALYAAFLLNEESVSALAEVHQRVERAGCKSFKELFSLYALAAGKSLDEIESRFGFDMPWRQLIRSKLVLRNYLQWHIGVVPLPNQQLRTVSIADNGTRRTEETACSSDMGTRRKMRIMVVGGSVAFGYGATSDAATIPGRLQHYLNGLERRHDVCWEVTNHAFPGATSFQELVSVAQRTGADFHPDYVVSLSGWNDVDDQFAGASPNVSGLAQNVTRGLERKTIAKRLMEALAQKSQAVAVMRRFVRAYQAWPGTAGPATGERGLVKTVPSDGRDSPDIYPLW